MYKSEHVLRLLVDHSPAAIALFDREMRYMFASRRYLHDFNLDGQDLIGRSHYEVFPEIPDRWKEIHQRCLSGVIEKSDEDSFIREDGKKEWTRWEIHPWYENSGEPGGIIMFVEVITERKLLEKELQNSEERYRSLVEATTSIIWTTDESGKFIVPQTSWERFTGQPWSEHKDFGWREKIHPDDINNLLSTWEKARNERSLYETSGKIWKDNIKQWRDFEIRAIPIINMDGSLREWVGVVNDISERKIAEEQLTYQASHDSLTGLINRHEFERRTKRLLSSSKQSNHEHALCFMDLDQFKVVNDSCGHAAGDELLRQLTSVLKDVVRKRDTLARLGGDEFGVLMEHCSLDAAHRVATSLQTAVQDYEFTWESHTFKISVSIGLVAITETTPSVIELLKDADAACYMAKEKGRNRIHVYHAEDSEMVQRHGEIQWVERLHKALEEDRFLLYAQIIISLDCSAEKHYEILLRMIDEKGDIILPGIFLPAAERYNLMSKIDRWVIEHAFGLLAENPEFLKQITFCSINLSGQSITDNDFLGFIMTQLNESGIQGEKICFEITETAAISNLSTAIKFISTLKEFGCQFALDDFGSGLSSFGYLKNLPVDHLKIDGMFVKNIIDDPIDLAMVKSINEIGHVMGMQTIAEFVENDAIKGMLKDIGVNYGQGYGIGKPQPFDELLGKSNSVNDLEICKA